MSSGRREVDQWFSREVQELETRAICDHILSRLNRNRERLDRAAARSAALEIRREVADSHQHNGYADQQYSWIVNWCTRMLELQDEIIADIQQETALLHVVSGAFDGTRVSTTGGYLSGGYLS